MLIQQLVHKKLSCLPKTPQTMQTLPSINNVQESIKSFTHDVVTNEMNIEIPLPIEIQATETVLGAPESNFSTEVSPVAASATHATTARDMLLAKAKAFRETQISQVGNHDKSIHPEQLSMMDEEKQFEDARKIARDILEVPAFIRKKQGIDLQN